MLGLVLLVFSLHAQNPVSYADAVIPQIPIGCGWKFTIVLMNLSSRDVTFKVSFWSRSGLVGPGDRPTLRLVPIEGLGPVGSVEGVLRANGSHTIAAAESARTARIGPDCNGWAEVTSEEAVGGYVLLNQQLVVTTQQVITGITGPQTTVFELDTTVPFASRFAHRFLVPFDTTASSTAIALVNPSFQVPATVAGIYRDELGRKICEEVRHLKPGEQQTFLFDPTSEASHEPACGTDGVNSFRGADGKGIRGVAEFVTSNLELSGLALRFGALGFVSYPAQSPIAQ